MSARRLKPTVDRAEPSLAEAAGGASSQGVTDGWRWATVDGMVAMDNRPLIDDADPLKPTPEYQSAVVPLAVLQHAVCNS